MPSFDVVSQVDMQEVRNALDQASREIANRFDFKGTDSSIDLSRHARIAVIRPCRSRLGAAVAFAIQTGALYGAPHFLRFEYRQISVHGH